MTRRIGKAIFAAAPSLAFCVGADTGSVLLARNGWNGAALLAGLVACLFLFKAVADAVVDSLYVSDR